MRLWIDSDVGDHPDDEVAIALAVRHPWVELVGISVVGNDATTRAERALAVARNAGQADLLVYASAPDPRALAEADAVLAIGPLTNLAGLIRAGVRLPPLAMMGGALAPVQHRGALRTVEHNLGADPHAAMTVLGGAGDLLLVPLDVTAEMALRPAEYEALTRLLPGLDAAVTHWRTGAGDHPLCLHDALALLALVGEAGATVEARRLGVTVEGALVEVADGPEADVVVRIDRDAAVARILDVLDGQDRPGA